MTNFEDRVRAVEVYLFNLRFDPNHHLGLGDIRLTMGQQEEILNILGGVSIDD